MIKRDTVFYHYKGMLVWMACLGHSYVTPGLRNDCGFHGEEIEIALPWPPGKEVVTIRVLLPWSLGKGKQVGHVFIRSSWHL